MNDGDSVTLRRDVPRPEDWVKDSPYRYEHKHTTDSIDIMEYEAKVQMRSILAIYIDEVDPL